MKRIDYLVCFILGSIACLSRIPLLEKMQSHWDGPQYSIAVVQYSFEHFTPAPPGYPLYIALGKFFYLFLHDPHTSILAVSVLGCVTGAIALYVVGKKMYHRLAGLAAAILFLTGSTFYYFSLTAYAYGLLIGTTTILAFTVYCIFINQKQAGIYLGLIAGICFGIRPQEMLQIGPLLLLGFIFLSKKEKLKAVFVAAFVTLLWFIPLVSSMGLQTYITASLHHAQTAFYLPPLRQHLELMVKGFLLSFGIASFFLMYYVWLFFKNDKKIVLFYSVWILPGIFYNVFIRTDHAGYQMSYLVAFLLLISNAIWQTTKKSKLLYTSTLLVLALFNVYWFFYNRDPNFIKPYRPTSFHYSEIRKNDLIVGNKMTFIQENFNPRETMVITTDVLWRPYTYYLKNYRVLALSGIHHPEQGFAYTIYEGFKWDMREYQNKKRTILIPTGIKTVVFPDNDVKDWIKNRGYKTYALPGNSSLYSFPVSPGGEIRFQYHFIEVIQ